MNVTQVFDQLNIFIDEADTTFVTDANRESWLEMAYNEFRERVIGVAPEVYMKSATLTLNNTSTYDLANPPAGGVTLLGANATERLYRIYRVSVPNTDGSVNRYLQAYANPKLFQNIRFAYADGWTLTGTKLLIANPISGNVRIDYIPMGQVDWTKHGPADNEFIDDLTPFHSIIAMLAAQYYQVADGAANAILDRQLQDRLRQLQHYVAQERTPEGAHYVEDRMDDWFV